MASDLMSIAKSGVQTARIALDVTAHNIANASSEGYVRRSVQITEVSGSGMPMAVGDVSLSGARLDSVVRNADLFKQAEVRRTGADAERANAELTGLENIEAAVEQSNIFPAIVDFEGALQQLVSDPTSNSLRAAVIEDANVMVRTFNIASQSLDAVEEGLHFEASSGVDMVNIYAQELARVNLRLARASDASSDQTALLDQRDALLQSISQFTDISTTIAKDLTVEVRIGGSSGPQLVSGGTATAFAMTTAADGTLSFDAGGTAVTLNSGSLAGKAQALTKLVDVRTQLDSVVTGLMTAINNAQTAGVALDGSAGQPMFSGTGAADFALAITNGAMIATAPAGAGANSRDPSNLNSMRNLLATADPTGAMDGVIFDISSTVAGRKITREALQTIADSAKVALQAQAGVSLDLEAVNLVRYQQAFQASSRVMQVAGELFDSILSIR